MFIYLFSGISCICRRYVLPQSIAEVFDLRNDLLKKITARRDFNVKKKLMSMLIKLKRSEHVSYCTQAAA